MRSRNIKISSWGIVRFMILALIPITDYSVPKEFYLIVEHKLKGELQLDMIYLNAGMNVRATIYIHLHNLKCYVQDHRKLL